MQIRKKKEQIEIKLGKQLSTKARSHEWAVIHGSSSKSIPHADLMEVFSLLTL